MDSRTLNKVKRQQNLASRKSTESELETASKGNIEIQLEIRGWHDTAVATAGALSAPCQCQWLPATWSWVGDVCGHCTFSRHQSSQVSCKLSDNDQQLRRELHSHLQSTKYNNYIKIQFTTPHTHNHLKDLEESDSQDHSGLLNSRQAPLLCARASTEINVPEMHENKHIRSVDGKVNQ